MTASGMRLFDIVVTGIVVIGSEQHPCTFRLGRSAERTFAFEECRLLNRIGSSQADPPLHVSGPDAMPIDDLLRALPALLTGKPASGDLDFTLLGVVTKPAIDHAAFVAAIRLRTGAGTRSELRVRLAPDTMRPFGFTWPRECTVDRWLRDLERASRRCPSAGWRCDG